jgi:hypothetical protein
MIYRAKNSQHPADYSHETHLLLVEVLGKKLFSGLLSMEGLLE